MSEHYEDGRESEEDRPLEPEEDLPLEPEQDPLEPEQDPLDKEDPFDEEDPGLEDDEDPGTATRDGSVNVEVDSVGDGPTQVTGVHQEFHQDSRSWNLYFQQKVEESKQRRLLRSSFQYFSRQQLVDLRQELAYDREEVVRLTDSLKSGRIALIQAPSGVGKTQLAVVAAAAMAQGSKEVSGLHRSGILGPRLHVDLHALFSDDSRLEGSVVVLQDAFSQGNQDLARFASRGDSMDLRQLADRLREAKSYLVLTMDENLDVEVSAELAGHRFEARGPDVSRQREVLVRLAEKRLRRTVGDEAQIEERMERLGARLDTVGEAGIERLGGVSFLKDFVAQYLEEFLAAEDPEAILDRAVTNQNRLDHWLLGQKENLEALAFLVSLAFCLGGGWNMAVRWRLFERIRIAILYRMRHELGIDEARNPSTFCDEQEMLEHFEVAQVPGEQGLYLRFQNAERCDQLWRALLDSGRRLLACAEPVLVEMCGDRDPSLGETAARGLLRMAQLDPFGIIVRRLGYWLAQSRRPGDRFMSAAGHLLRAVSESDTKWLADECKARVQRELKSRDSEQVVAGLRALAALGDGQLKLGARELEKVVGRWLIPPIEALRKADLDRRLEEIELARGSDDRRLRSLVSELHEALLKGVLEALFRDRRRLPIYRNCQWLLVSWILEHGAIDMIGELDRWMPDGDEGYPASALALMFLGSDADGIFAVVSRFRSSGAKEWEPILLATQEKPRGAARLARFLFKLYLGFRPFPPRVQQILRRNFRDRLDAWIRLATESPEQGEVVLDLWRALCRKPDQELRALLWDLLQDLRHRGPDFEDLAEDLECLMPG